MLNETGLENLYEIFEWSTDPTAVIRDDKIIYANRAFIVMLPYISVGSHIDRLIPDFASYENCESIHNFSIDECACTVKISRIDELYAVTLCDIVRSSPSLETSATLCRWLRSECIRLKAPLLTITSALNSIMNSLPPDLYSQFSDHLASINQNSYRSQKILNNIAHITNRLNPDDPRGLADLTAMCKAFVTSFHSFFAPHKISISSDIPDDEIFMYCNISEIRRAIYNTICFVVDCISDSGTVFLSVSVEDNNVIMKFSARSSSLDREKFASFCDDDEGAPHLIKSIVASHNGHISFSPDNSEIQLVINRELPESEFIRDKETEYDIGNLELLTEFSDVLPQDFYKTR